MKKILLLLLLSITLYSNSQVCYNSNSEYNLDSFVFKSCTGDFNSDGKVDIITMDRTRDFLFILEGNGDGTFKTPVELNIDSENNWEIHTIQCADFNNDGKFDIAVTSDYGDWIAILLGNGNCTFGDATYYDIDNEPQGFICRDFNNDSNIDLAITCSYSNNIMILLGNGNGTFQTGVSYVSGDNPIRIAGEDYNNDGEIDLSVSNAGEFSAGTTISILLGNGNGTFGTATTYSVGNEPADIVNKDFNRDGKIDIAVCNYNSNTISILLGQGNGTFNSATTIPTGDSPNSIISIDINSDNNFDLVYANGNETTISVLLGNGNGSFSSAVNFTVGLHPLGLTYGNFDSNGTIDLAVSNCGSSTLQILLNCTTPIFNNLTNNNNGITIFPNPSQGIFTIQSSMQTIDNVKIFSNTGNKYLTTDLHSKTGTIDASTLPNGEYILNITTETGIIHSLLLINK